MRRFKDQSARKSVFQSLEDAGSECPPDVFRIRSTELFEAGDFAAADRISSRGVVVHPENLWLATSHASIAEKLADAEEQILRWRRVIDLGGAKAAAKAFKNLADLLNDRGDHAGAEALVRQGMAAHPGDLYLAERLPKMAASRGFMDRSISLWRELIERFPDQAAGFFVRICDACCAEGLLDRAEQTLREGLDRHPGEARLLLALSKLHQNRGRLAGQASAAEVERGKSLTGHLFGGNLSPFGQGTVSFPLAFDAINQHVAGILDFETCVAPIADLRDAERIDVFTAWGSSTGIHNKRARDLAAATGKPLLCLEFGFISFAGLAINNAPGYSLIICPDSIYFDATQASKMEKKLNSTDFILTSAQLARSGDCIAEIVREKITKYNHAPRIDLRSEFPPGRRKRVLLVDQRFGDKAVFMGLGGEATFERMWEYALSLPDHEIVVKLHPDAISGKYGSYLARIVPPEPPSNVILIDYDINPFCLFEVVDKVLVCTSQLGFEALMAGKEVHCFGAPFYAGWGLTTDHGVVPRRKRCRTMEEVFHLFYIDYTRYFIPSRGVVPLEDLLRHFAGQAETLAAPPEPQPAPTPTVSSAPDRTGPLSILIVIPSGRHEATGRYVQTLSESLVRQGCRVMVLTERRAPESENGVFWQQIEFEGSRLAPRVREMIVRFGPDVIYENGVRSVAQRAALEALVLTGARLAMQSEDDDVQVHAISHDAKAALDMTALDKPRITTDEIDRFLRHHDWRHTLAVLLDPAHDRWVEPLMRVLCYRLAEFHTAIWHPFERRLAGEYGVPTLVVPPVATASDFERMELSSDERAAVLARHSIPAGSTVLFIAGALYSASAEYALFLEALNLCYDRTGKPMTLVVISARSPLPIARMAMERLRAGIGFADLKIATDPAYMEMLKACDVVCSPGLPDTFNRYRLPSRFVKAMAMGKPILTCRCGFGESLEHGTTAFLMDGADPSGWVDAIALSLDPQARARVNGHSKAFARRHFDSDQVAAALKQGFENMLARPKRALADGIEISTPEIDSKGATKARLRSAGPMRNRYITSMQNPIHVITALDRQLDTVIHIGAGEGGELQDYCRMGASRVVMVDASPEKCARLREQENIHGSMMVIEAAVAANAGPVTAVSIRNTRTDADVPDDIILSESLSANEVVSPWTIGRRDTVHAATLAGICERVGLSGGSNVILLEINGLETEVLRATPAGVLRRFRWIAVNLDQSHAGSHAGSGTGPDAILADAGFVRYDLAVDHSRAGGTALFRRGGDCG